MKVRIRKSEREDEVEVEEEVDSEMAIIINSYTFVGFI